MLKRCKGSAFIWFVQMFCVFLSEIPDFLVWNMSEIPDFLVRNMSDIPDFWVLQDI